MGSVQIGTARVGFDDEGEGPPLVLVHATAGSRLNWSMITPFLVPAWRVVMPELSGSGETVDDGGPLEVDDLVGQVLGVADHLGIDRFHLGGYSLGGAVSAAVAAKAGDRVASLTVLFSWARSGPAERFQFETWRQVFEASPALFGRMLVLDGLTPSAYDLYGEGVETFATLLGEQVAAGTARQAELDSRLDVSDRLGSITAPTRVVGGTVDRILPIAHSRALASSIPGAELVEVDGNHLYLLEQPEATARLIETWAAAHPV